MSKRQMIEPKSILIKSPNVANVLQALNAIQVSINDMNNAEMKELTRFMYALAGAFEADAPELNIPHVDDVTMHIADLAGMVRDSWGLE